MTSRLGKLLLSSPGTHATDQPQERWIPWHRPLSAPSEQPGPGGPLFPRSAVLRSSLSTCAQSPKPGGRRSRRVRRSSPCGTRRSMMRYPTSEVAALPPSRGKAATLRHLRMRVTEMM